MYKLIKPLLFKIDPEMIHHTMVGLLRFLRYVPLAPSAMRALFTVRHPSLERELFGLKFPNPVGLAAGFDKDAECADMLANLGFGFVEIGTVTPRAQGGNPRPRCFRLVEDQAIVNRMGFNNKGAEHAAESLRLHNKHRIIVGGNIGKNTLTNNDHAASDYLRAFRSLYDYVDYFVVNVSCPNVANLTQLQNKEGTMEIINALKDFRKGQSEYRPILLKISPDLTREGLDTMIDVVRESKLDGIVATNTTTSREGLKTPTERIDKIGRGGLSGAPLTLRARQTVSYIHQRTGGRIPIIGVGGIMSVEDAQAMLEAGASLIQIYSGFIYQGPSLASKICKTLQS
ncbi:MAG: quinone-dependent dihydroorotate dehydrogenase [Mucinivorans sp.]